MKKILHILSIALISTWTSAQSIIVTDESNNVIENAGVVSLSLSTNELISGEYLEPKFLVKNNTDENLVLFIRRTIVDVPSQWEDQVCWPPSCFITNNAATYSTPTGTTIRTTVLANSSLTNHIEIHADDTPFTAYIKPNIYINNTFGVGTYRYEVVDFESNDVLFTFDLELTTTLTTSNLKKESTISLAPNPASDIVTISIPDGGSGSIQMIDVLGNVVYNSEFTGSKKINTATFKNGVYFVVINTNGMKTNKKLVVRH